ncbi:hypothetical protein [Demequina sp.]|uniref:hypothetical protein n=1 Tax=Demequina sp. TaxID=2050685 RepID=UPI003A89EC01
MAEDDDWEPASIPPRGTRWTRDEDGAWVPDTSAPGEAPQEPASDSNRDPDDWPTYHSPYEQARRRGASLVTAGVILGSVLLAVVWWGTLGAAASFVYISPYPMLDFIVLSSVTVAWCAFVWRWLNRPR